MSDYGDGTQPPPPPYGGDPQGGQPYGTPPPVPPPPAPPQYGAPAGQPYGSPPPPPPYGAPAGQPYGSPAADSPYGYPPAGQPYGYPPAAPAPYGQPAYGMPQQYPGAPALATMGKRLGARLIDGLITGAVVGLLALLLLGSAFSQVETDPVTGQVTSGGAGLAGAFFGLFAIVTVFGLFYEVGLIALRGATPGKQILGIKVVREADGQVPGWGPAVLRWLIPLAGSMVCGFGQYVVYLSPFWDSSQRLQGWHDKVAKTLVVSTR